jgi:hypothetical protein
MASFADNIASRLADVGLAGATLVSSSPSAQSFGDGEAVFRLDGLLLRFVRDRRQAFVDIASSAAPTEFHQYDDIEIAMGWKTIDQVLAKRVPEDLGLVLERLRTNLDVLGNAFSSDRERFTRARVERAARERGRAFADRLRGKK